MYVVNPQAAADVLLTVLLTVPVFEIAERPPVVVVSRGSIIRPGGCRPGTVTTYRWCFADFLRFAEGREYQYHLERGLGGATVRLRLAVLASFARWAVRSGKLLANPVESLVRPPRRTTLPGTLGWDAVQDLLDRCRTRRDRAKLKRTKNLRAVQQHLRHRDIQSTTVYARLLPDELAEAVSVFDA